MARKVQGGGDEATRALDPGAETIVAGSQPVLRAPRVAMAPRHHTIIDADDIDVVDRGRPTQPGPDVALLAQPGVFADLARRQLA